MSGNPQPPFAEQNPYQAPATAVPRASAVEADNPHLVKILRDFRSQIVALGAFWIFIGAAAMALAAFGSGLLAEGGQRMDPTIVGIWGTVGLVWTVLGVLVCMKHIWAVYVALALSYLSLLGQVLSLRVCAIVLLIVVILQAHRVLGWARELTQAGIPLTTRPDELATLLARQLPS